MRSLQIQLAILLLVLVFSQTHAQQRSAPADGDHDSWVRIEVREAFVSRQTYIDFRDTFSEAEFGWHVALDGSRMSRGNRLYSTMYYPAIEGSTVRLILVELDAFSDDIVSGVDLKDGVDRYEMNNNGDWALIRRTPFRPDGNSGPDARPDGARLFKADLNDTVSFLDGDYTDYYRLPAGSLAMVISAQIPLSVPDESLTVYPRWRGMKSAQLLRASDSDGLFRIRSSVGSGMQRYRILYAGGAAAGTAMLDKAVAYLENTVKLPSIFTASDIANVFIEFDHDMALQKCRAIQARASRSENCAEFCKTVTEEKK